MTKLKFSLILLITIFFLKNSLADNYSDKLDELMLKYDKSQLFSGVVLLAKDGDILYEKTFGYADWENKTPVNNQTLFNIASIGKAFTHTIIKQLESEGKLSLNDPLNKYLSIYPDDIGSKITISMLIEMKAGLGDYGMNPEYNRNPDKFTTIDAYLDLIKTEPLLYEPGTGREYSNSGYAVLGGVIEKVTGKSYEVNLKERIFEPLGMKNTYYKQLSDKIPNSAVGTMINFAGTKRSIKREFSPSPAGGMYSNAEDLFKMDAYIRNSKIIGLAARAGGTPTWNSMLGQYENGYTLIILSNFGKVADDIEAKFRKIMKNENYSAPLLPLQMQLYKVLTDEGSEGLKNNLEKILKENDEEYGDMALNGFGYQLMQAGELDKAIEVFKINTQLFPNIANTYDSLAEAYMNKGNNELAIENFKKVLEMRPQNENAKQMLEKLQTGSK